MELLLSSVDNLCMCEAKAGEVMTRSLFAEDAQVALFTSYVSMFYALQSYF